MNETLSHLQALRESMIRAFIGYGIIAIISAIYANYLFSIFSLPILSLLPTGSMIATDVTTPFLIPLTFSLMLALCISMPWILYQGWRFIGPALFTHEKKRILLLSCFSLILFYAGLCLAYFFVIPLALKFFVHAAPQGVEVLTDIDAYFNFAMTMMIAFGFAFQVPLVVMALIKTNVITRETLISKRPYVIIICFIVGMLLTPPDVFSQTLLAIPMWGLFELGLFLAKL